MKKLLAALFLLTLASSTPAKANSLITASVYNRDLNGNVCSTTQSASTSLSLACGSTSGNTGYVAVNASLGTLSGYVDESIQPVSTNNGLNDTFETESYTASLTGTYMLTGGTGSGYVSFILSHFDSGLYVSFPQCTLTLDGQSEACGYTNLASFYVPYNTPFALDLELTQSGGSGGPYGGTVDFGYDFSQLTVVTPVSPVPEPASLLLLGTGLIPLVQRLRRRA